MVSVEYEAALRFLREAAKECRAGNGRVVLVEAGLAGGKTHLLHEFSKYVVESGALLVYATASRDEQALPMGVADQLFRSVSTVTGSRDELPGLPAPVISGVNGGTESGHPDSGQKNSHSIASSVYGACLALQELSKERPLVVVVDDLHFADLASVQILLSLQRRIRAAPIMLVVSQWTRSRPTQPEVHAELTRYPHHRIRLLPSTEQETHKLIEEALGETAAEKLTTSYLQLTSGNPLLLRALTEDYRAAVAPDEIPAEPPVGGNYAQAIVACLHRWDPRLLDVAKVIAILGDQSTPT